MRIPSVRWLLVALARCRSLAVLCACLVSAGAFAAVPRPTAETPFVNGAGHLEMFVDETAALTTGEVLGTPARFHVSPKATPNLGVTAHALWVRLMVAEGTSPFFVEVPYAQFDHVTLVVERPDGTRREVRTGDARPFADRDQPEATFVFEVTEPVQALYLRIASTGNVSAPVLLWEPRAYFRKARDEHAKIGVYLGILAVMAAYNLLLFAMLREKIYAMYVGFLLAFVSFELALTGVGYQYFWGASPLLQARASSVGLAAVCLLLFSLCTRTIDAAAHLPRLGRLLVVVERSFCAVTLGAFVLPPRLLIGVLAWAGPVSLLLCLFALVLRVRQGSAPARYMLMGNLALMLAMATFAMKSAGVLPVNAFTAHAKEAGVVIQVVLFSLGLAARIEALQDEVSKSQAISLAGIARTNVELARLDKLKDEFLANTSHELRTPLNGILGLAETLVSGATDAATKRTAELIMTSGRRLSTIVDDVLSFATLRADGAALSLSPVDVSALVAELKTVFQRQADDRKIVLTTHSKLDGLGCQGDLGKLEQVLHQLVGNALKFTESGTVTLRAEHDAGRISISVIDTGPGIDAQAAAGLFTALEQVDGSGKRETGGLGLGLPLARRIVELLGGELRMTTVTGDSPAHGTTFSFSLEACALPAVEARPSVQVRVNAFASVSRSIVPPPSSAIVAASRPMVPEFSGGADRTSSRVPSESMAVARFGPSGAGLQRSPSGGPPVSSGRVLAVDDEPINLAVLSRQLTAEGFEVVKASSGPEALEILARESFDIVLLDVMMPKMSGYEVCRTIREEDRHKEMSIVLVTAKAQEQDVVDGFGCGATDYIRKPFSKGELISRVNSHVRETRMRRSISRFVPAEFLRLLGRKQISDVQLGDQVERDIAVLFSDIRDFTKLCESLSPEETFRFINRCLERIGPQVRAHGGFIDKYIGDAIMALFPERGVDALRAAVAMHRAVEAFNAEGSLTIPFAIGIGIHRGRTMLGTIGEEQRMEATVVSDAVNVASRLEGLTKVFGARVIVSAEVCDDAKACGMTLRGLGHVNLKGRDGRIEVFEVLDADPDGVRWAKLASLESFAGALASWEGGDVEGAREGFLVCAERCPEDGAAQYFLGEILRLDGHSAQSRVQAVGRP